MARKRTTTEQPYPIIEAFGFPVDAVSEEAIWHRKERFCPFAKNPCEKFRQYRTGYCSVTYAAADDEGIRRTYAVCDHRVDGTPLDFVVSKHFGDEKVELIPEIVLTDPRTSFDYAAFTRKNGNIDKVIAIETQAIDLRGGGVKPAWDAWVDGKLHEWREYFTREAKAKFRKDNVAYGINTANIYKRLGLQAATKGTYLKAIGVPFYIVMQDRIFDYLRKRVQFDEASTSNERDITFVTFDYSGTLASNGQINFIHKRTIATSLESYTKALTNDPRAVAEQREQFMERVRLKAQQAIAAPVSTSYDGRTGPVGEK